MTDYYLDPAKAYSDATGVDKTGNEYTGPAGLQAAIRGTGNATALVKGDTLYIKAGTGDQSRLVLIDCNGTSVTAWGIGDVVHNKDAGSTWQGVVVETNSGGFLGANDLALVWLDSGYDKDDILIAEGVTNDDAGGGANDPTDVDPLAAVSAPGNATDNNTGDADEPISVIAVNAAWVEDGSEAIFDAKDIATYNFDLAGKDYLHFRNIHGANAASHGWVCSTGLSVYSHFEDCVASGSGGCGFGGLSNIRYSSFHRCRAYDIAGTYGITGLLCSYSHCVAYNCVTGFYPNTGGALSGCLAYQCTTGIKTGQGSTLYNCVADDNTTGVSIYVAGASLVGVRITNNTTGVGGTSAWYEKFCFYGGNTANWTNANGVDLVDGASTRTISDVVADIGYIDPDNATLADRNYALTNQASARRQAVTL